ncbi:Serine/threonine-protein phosphatase 4 regulatory subunit 1 [Mortierella sp. NVP41]|nr:Serine/threonine-protein phosphatase 4 regulatory subunit 1 [Mortierella sp. NVP41]
MTVPDLGIYFGEDEDDAQMEQDDKELDYLVLANEQDDTFDTETLLTEMSADPLTRNSNRADLEVDADVVELFADEHLPPSEKVRLLSKSAYDFHRSFLAREVSTLLPVMHISDAIASVIPMLQVFSVDPMESVRESLASQLDKVVIHFLQHARIRAEEETPAQDLDEMQDQDTMTSQELADPSSLPHNIFTPIFINLLLDQNAGIAHQTRQVVAAVAENISDELLESEILNGVIDGLENLYESAGEGSPEPQEDAHDPFSADNNEDQDGEAELGKMLVVVLLTSLAKALGRVRCTEIVLPKLEKLVKQSQFYVRKEIVLALGTLCKVMDQDVVVNKLLPMFDTFVRDDTWHIRRACCTILPSFSQALPLELRTRKVEEIYDLYAVDVSRTVRNSVMEVLGEVIHGFEKDNVPEPLLNHFLNMGQHPMNEHELAVMCAFSFPAVVLTAGRSKWPQMKPVYMKLAGTFRFPIRRSLACSLHEVAKILGPELADRDLATAFSECLMAEDEVKEGVIGHVVEFISCLSPKKRSEALKSLSTAWMELEQSSNWRLRDSLAGQLPGLCEIAEGKDLVDYLIPLSIRACTDSVSTIRESGVMAFPALWDASARIGSYDPKALSSELACTSEQEEDDGPVPGVFGEGEDVEMEDLTAQLNGPAETPSVPLSNGISGVSNASAPPTPAPTSTAASTAPRTTTTPPAETPAQDDAERTTTIQTQVIRQTVEFAMTGGFRSRVVAVQIIQSLLDSGMSVEDFEAHFLNLLVERLATDTVVNVRIWVSRVVSWIIDSGFYNDAPESNRLQGLLTTMQRDPDRDVRIYAGGPAELPKPKKKKKKSGKSKGKNKKKTNGSFGAIAEGDEDAEGDQEMQLLGGEKGSDEDEDDDEEGETDSDEDESSDESLEFLNAAKAKGISNKPRNRNSIGLGMKVMVNNKLTVSGKEIRKPKTSWDYIHGEIDDDEEDGSGDGTVKSFSASLGSKEALERHWEEDEGDDGEGVSLFDAPRQFDEGEGESLFDAPREFGDGEGESLFDAPRRFSAGYSDDDDEEEDAFAKALATFKENSDTKSASTVSVAPTIESTTSRDSPMEVEMEEAVQDGSGERVAVVVSGSNGNALAGQEPTLDAGRVERDSELKSAPELVLPTPIATPAVSQYPPLSSATAPSVNATALTQAQAPAAAQAQAQPPSSSLSYAALVKKDERNGSSPKKTLVPMVANRGAVTVDAAAARNGTSPPATTGQSKEANVIRALNAKLQATGTLGKKGLPPPLSITPINTTTATTTNTTSANGSAKRALAYKDPGSPSYAAIVASGATSPHPGRLVFSPPFPPMTTPTSTFSAP